MSTPAPAVEPDNSLKWVASGVAVASIILGIVLYARYSEFRSYIRTTLEHPEATPSWRLPGMTPERCVDQAMAWTASCHGIKNLCDVYTTRVMEECLQPLDLTTYCGQLTQIETIARFGQQECLARGVRREVSANSCSKAYKAIAETCADKGRGAHQGKSVMP